MPGPRGKRHRPPGSPTPGEPGPREWRSIRDLALRTGEEPPLAGRSRALALLARALTGSARAAGLWAVAGGRWLSDELAELAQRIPVRDLAALRAHHPGCGDEEIAQTLVTHAARTTAAIGAAAGALATAEYAAPPTLLAAPVQIAAESLAVAAAAVKLVAG